MADGLHTTQIVSLFLLLSVVALAALARKLQTPYPIVLVVGGLLLGFVPGIPKVNLNPEIIFLVVLPPLLYSAAWNTSWAGFMKNIVSIGLLAFGLVAFTVAGVAIAGPILLPGFDWRLGFVLGAVVATTDSIAATSIAKRVGLPKRLVDILEGESLLNDATGLLALEFGIAMVVYGTTPTVGSGILRLVYLSLAGIAVGLLLARIVEWVEYQIDDGPIEIAISLIVPYAAYLAAELIHASGVLAVVAAGLYLGRKSSRFFSPSVRIQAGSTWNALTFMLNGLVFLAIGLQLPFVLDEIRGLDHRRLLMDAAVFCAFLIILRLIWTFPGSYISFKFRTLVLHQEDSRPTAPAVFVIGWTGMRGVIALAAALSLPQEIENGSPFPNRSLIVFLTFSVILVTLVLQGLTLPPLIRALKLVASPGDRCEEEEARRLVLESALAHIDENRAKDLPFAAVYDDVAKHYHQKLSSLQCLPNNTGAQSYEAYEKHVGLSRDLLDVERETALRLRTEGRISDEILRTLEHELDLSVLRLSAVSESENG